MAVMNIKYDFHNTPCMPLAISVYSRAFARLQDEVRMNRGKMLTTH